MVGVSKRREYLGTFFDSRASPEDGQHLPQRPSGEVKINISTAGLCSTNNQANNPVPRKAETRTTKMTRYKAHQLRHQEEIQVSLVFNEARSWQEAKNLFP